MGQNSAVYGEWLYLEKDLTVIEEGREQSG